MAANITYKISESNFEIVRDQIGALLFVELDNQALLNGTGDPVVPDSRFTADVYIERMSAVDFSEGNVINVGIINMSLDNDTPITQRNRVDFYIDIYCNVKDQTTSETCDLSGLQLHRLVGLVRHILMSPIYKRLGSTSNNLVMHRSLRSANFVPSNDQDMQNVRASRMILTVDIHEEVSGQTPVTADSYLTTVKLNETEKGYKFIYSNP